MRVEVEKINKRMDYFFVVILAFLLSVVPLVPFFAFNFSYTTPSMSSGRAFIIALSAYGLMYAIVSVILAKCSFRFSDVWIDLLIPNAVLGTALLFLNAGMVAIWCLSLAAAGVLILFCKEKWQSNRDASEWYETSTDEEAEDIDEATADEDETDVPQREKPRGGRYCICFFAVLLLANFVAMLATGVFDSFYYTHIKDNIPYSQSYYTAEELTALSRLKEAEWRKLDDDRKLELLQRVCTRESQRLGIGDVPTVRIAEEQMTGFDADTNTIWLDLAHGKGFAAAEEVVSAVYRAYDYAKYRLAQELTAQEELSKYADLYCLTDNAYNQVYLKDQISLHAAHYARLVVSEYKRKLGAYRVMPYWQAY